MFLFEISEIVKSVFGLVFAVIVLQLIVFLLLVKPMSESKSPTKFGKAIFSYVMMTIGVILMSLSAIPTTISVLSSTAFNPEVYLSLLLVFAMGGLMFLWNDYRLREIDEKTKAIPGVMYFFVMKAIGQLSLVLAVLYLTLTIVLGDIGTPGWWSIPLTIALYGIVMSVLTTTDGLMTAPGGKRKKK